MGAPAAPPDGGLPALANVQVLCVDDDPLVLRQEKYLLTREGAEVVTAADGAQALETLDLFLPDVILLDVLLTDTDGRVLCVPLSPTPRGSGVPMTFVTALKGNHDRARAFAGGEADILTRPVFRDDLVLKIRRLLEAGAGSGRPIQAW
jgi:DNA-binding response OmpR family regulator